MKEEILKDIRSALQGSAEERVQKGSGRFFKAGEAAQVYGTRMPEVKRVAKESFRQIKPWSKGEIFETCEALWKSQFLEEAIVACLWSEWLHRKYQASDFRVFEHWVHNYVNSWADCDTLCTQTIGRFVMMYPDFVEELKRWTKASNRWAKRASAVSLVKPAKEGRFLKDIFEIADVLLLDRDDLVQKGYGWVLKVASQTYQQEVFDFVMSRKSRMPRTALRYAIAKFPRELRNEAMAK